MTDTRSSELDLFDTIPPIGSIWKAINRPSMLIRVVKFEQRKFTWITYERFPHPRLIWNYDDRCMENVVSETKLTKFLGDWERVTP